MYLESVSVSKVHLTQVALLLVCLSVCRHCARYSTACAGCGRV